MGLLDGIVARIMRNAFAGIYLPATLYMRTMTYDGGGTPTATEQQYSCRAQVDVATEAMRQGPGYTEKTFRVLVLKDTLAVVPTSNDVIAVGGQSFNVSSVGTDPANSYWDMQVERA